MQSCRITITTSVDGQETQTMRQGKMLLSSASVTLTYQEDGDEVVLFLENGKGKMKRTGNQCLTVPFDVKASMQGEIVVGGMRGTMGVQTHAVAFSIGKQSMLAQLHYDLIFGQEKQTMRLRIHACAINNR